MKRKVLGLLNIGGFDAVLQPGSNDCRLDRVNIGSREELSPVSSLRR